MANHMKEGLFGGVVARGKKTSRRRAGRPTKGEQLTEEDYCQAMRLSAGNYTEAARILGVSIQSVSSAAEKYPSVKELRVSRNVARWEKSLSIIDEILEDKRRKHKSEIRLFAAKFALRSCPEFKQQSEVDATVAVTELPSINVNFIRPQPVKVDKAKKKK